MDKLRGFFSNPNAMDRLGGVGMALAGLDQGRVADLSRYRQNIQGRRAHDELMGNEELLAQFTPEQRQILSTMRPEAAQQLIADTIFAKPDPLLELQMQQARLGIERSQLELDQIRSSQPERKVIKGADGYSYYQDTQERVLPDVISSQPAQTRILTPEEVAAVPGLDPQRAYQQAPDGRITALGGGQTINVNTGMGGEPGRYIYAEDAGLPKGWRFDTQTQQAEMIPGGPAAVEAAQAEEKAASVQDQTHHKLGTTLSSLALNLDEIKDGGLPVTGAVGDLRRTWAGRLLTGSGAVDFGNRTNQITDAAALDEISRMRQSSPTGGAVGALTDGERVAIGNAVTALNNSTSAEEYTRAAKEFRTLVLDLSYGSGQWFLRDDGVSVGLANGDNPFPDPAEMSGTEIEAYVAVNPADNWTPEQRSAFANRLRQLKGEN